MKFFLVPLGIFLACLGSGACHAAISVSVDLDPITPGIQITNPTPIGIGESITANLVMQMTAPTTLGGYNFSVQFGNGLTFVSRSESSFGSLNPIDNSNAVNGNLALRFDGADFGAGQLQPLGPLTVGSLTFTLANAQNTNIAPGLFEPAFDLFVAADGITDLTSSVAFNSGTVSAVPEPTSLVLLGAACLSGVMRRRRR